MPLCQCILLEDGTPLLLASGGPLLLEGSPQPCTIFPTGILQPPLNLRATADIDAILLEWVPVTGATGYNVYRGTASSGLSLLAPNVGEPFTDVTPIPGVVYYYEVTALLPDGESGPSNLVMATALAAPIGNISGSYATSGRSSGGGEAAFLAKKRREQEEEEDELLLLLG